MKSNRFRNISISVICLLVVLLGINIWYLVGLYGSIEQTTRQQLHQALVDADIDEILNRVPKHRLDTIPGFQLEQMSQSRSIVGDTLYITVEEAGKEAFVRKKALPKGTNYSDNMLFEIGLGAHETIDRHHGPFIEDVDSLFKRSLAKIGIHPEVCSVVMVDSLGNFMAGDSTKLSQKDLSYCEVEYDIYGNSYRGYYSSLTGHILRQMWVIIATTLLIVILLAFAFWYLINTVLKLRSIEEMKDDFVNNMTHELKTPIAIAYSANDALLNYDEGNDRQKQQKYLAVALEQLNRLSGLVENILSMSMERRKTLAFNKEGIELLPFVSEIAASQELRTDKEIKIEVEASPENVTVEADPTHLANIIHNLIDNSIKYSGSAVDIKIRIGTASMEVSDNGIGISAKDLPHIFDKFYRVPTGNRLDVSGYGIGLFYVKSIVEKMGWNIEVESKKGDGTKFIIRFCHEK